jgi:hypothetical protein
MTQWHPPERPRYVPIFEKPGARYLMPTFGALGCAIGAFVGLFLGIRLLFHTVELANRGAVVQAEVVSARYGSRADFVRVRLPAPMDRADDLIAWSGAPRPGETIAVRYDPSSPAVAEQAGEWPWVTLSLEFGVAGIFVFGCWREASRPWRQERRTD